MVQTIINWPDGSRIYYKTDTLGNVRRCVDFADGEGIDNAGKYYYLRILENYKDIGNRTYQDLEYICNMVSDRYSLDVEKELCRRFSDRIYGEGNGACIFMTIIYLAMIDLEEGKKHYNWLGKELVLNSCKAVLIDGISYEKAAVMGPKTIVVNGELYDDYDDEEEEEDDERTFGWTAHDIDEAYDIAYEGNTRLSLGLED